MDPEILRALKDGHSPQEIAAELRRRGLPVPPQLLLGGMPMQPSAAPPRMAPPTATQQVGSTSADALGVAAPVAAAGAVVGGGVAARLAGRAAMDRYAAKQLREAVTQSGGVDELMKRVQQFDETGRGHLVTLSDLDPRLTAEADFVATNHTPTRVQLSELNTARRKGVPGRLGADAEQLAPGGYVMPQYMNEMTHNSQQDFAASDLGFEGLREANPEMSAKAMRRLFDFTQSPELSRVWNDAAQAGLIPPMDKDAPQSFAVLQDMKERLDDATSEAFRKGRGQLGTKLGAARDHLVTMLQEEVPGYASVASQYSVFARRKAMLERGREVWNDHTVQVPDLDREIASLSSEELKAFRQGVLGGYLSDIENAQTNRNLATQLMERSATMERKLKLIFGSEAAFKDAVTRYAQEAAMGRLGQVVGGSQTARRMGAQSTAAADAVEGATDAAHVLLHPTTGIPLVARGKLSRWLPGAVATRMAPAFTEQSAEALRAFLRALPK